MITFEQVLLNTAWIEILGGKTALSFDLIGATNVEVLFTETADTPDPTVEGNLVQSWGDNWDFQITHASINQRVWVKGTGTIRGVR